MKAKRTVIELNEIIENPVIEPVVEAPPAMPLMKVQSVNYYHNGAIGIEFRAGESKMVSFDTYTRLLRDNPHNFIRME